MTARNPKSALSQTKLEDRFVRALRRVPGFRNLRWVSIRPHRSEHASWSLSRIYPPVKGNSADWTAFNRVRSEMQAKYELRTGEEQLDLPFPKMKKLPPRRRRLKDNPS